MAKSWARDSAKDNAGSCAELLWTLLAMKESSAFMLFFHGGRGRHGTRRGKRLLLVLSTKLGKNQRAVAGGWVVVSPP